jgi:hypothetical protein
MIVGFCLIGVFFCNIAVVVLATRRSVQRQRAIMAAGNVTVLRHRGSIVDIRA